MPEKGGPLSEPPSKGGGAGVALPSPEVQKNGRLMALAAVLPWFSMHAYVPVLPAYAASAGADAALTGALGGRSANGRWRPAFRWGCSRTVCAATCRVLP